MQTVLYRNADIEAVRPSVDCERPRLVPLDPGLVYPVVSDGEYAMWEAWLPQVYTLPCADRQRRHLLFQRWSAPDTVYAEATFAAQSGLFEAFELRTPQRIDQRDPLLLGLANGQRYRIALWGESLRPMDEIRALVAQSAGIRRRADAISTTMVMGWLGCGGVGIGGWLASLLGAEVPHAVFGVSILGFIMLLFATGWYLESTPENRQQDFLDRYRQ